jgi:hypothetical protein
MLVSGSYGLRQEAYWGARNADKVFELVEGNLSNEKRTDIYQIAERFKGDPMIMVGHCGCQGNLPAGILRDLPRTRPISPLLVDEVGKATPLAKFKPPSSA